MLFLLKVNSENCYDLKFDYYFSPAKNFIFGIYKPNQKN